MGILTIIAFVLIACLLLGGTLVAILIIHKNLSRLEHQERESGEKLEEEMSRYYDLHVSSDNVSPGETPAKAGVQKSVTEEMQGVSGEEPDVFAATQEMARRTDPTHRDLSDSERPPRIPPEGIILPDHFAPPPPPEPENTENAVRAFSELPEINRKARSGDPVALAIWKIHEAGQLETLEEVVALGQDYSAGRAVRLTNGKRLIVVPPNHPEDSIKGLLRDCDGLVVFPDAHTPLIAEELGKHLVDNIFNASQKP